MDNDLYSQIKEELQQRKTWEEKQAAWYQMRYSGIRRAKKPYPNAPDMHYKLVDTMIEKLKPLYVSLIYQQERLAAFASKNAQSSELTSVAERLFDFTVKQETNFERSIYIAIDMMLQYGRGPLKTRWDVDKRQIQYSNIRPIHIIVPSWTEELCEADWLVHVMHLSVDQYKRNPKFKQDKTFIQSIKGRGEVGMSETDKQTIARREGITVGQNENQIVLWEVYSRDSDGNILIDTISPMRHKDEVCEQVGLPYRHKQLPFSDLRYEIQDGDYYSVRGLAEILSEDEQSLNKLWNHLLQWLDFYGQPNFVSEAGTSVPSNFQNKPGAILPPGLTLARPERIPLDFQAQMEFRRALAEDRVQVPDLSAGQHLTGNRGSGGDVTATQINAIVGQSGSGNDLRTRTFKMQLAPLYRQTWSLMAQYMDAGELVLDDLTEVPQNTMNGDYRILPNGSADAYSKEQRVQKALAYYQTFNQNPYLNQGEITKWVWEQEDSALVKRFYQDPNDKQLTEGENQALELLLMEKGYPAQVQRSDDHKVHLQNIAGWMERKRALGEPITPETATLVMQHGQGHAQGIQENRDKEGMMMLKQLQPYVGVLQQIVQQSQAGLPSGAIPGPDEAQMPQGQGMPALPAPAGPEQAGMAPVQQGQIAGQQTPSTATIQLSTPAPVVDLSQLQIPAPIVRVEAPASPPPVVTVEPPVVNVPAPIVNVPAPVVNVPAPVVNVQPDRAKTISIKSIKRDKDGNLIGAEIERK